MKNTSNLKIGKLVNKVYQSEYFLNVLQVYISTDMLLALMLSIYFDGQVP